MIGTYGSAGTGGITFAAGAPAGTTLMLRDGVTTPLPNSISGFAFGEAIDIKGLTYAAGASAQLSGTTLTVYSNGTTTTLQLAGASGQGFAVRDDGTGDAEVVRAVVSEAELNAQIGLANHTGAGAVTIDIATGFSLTSAPTAINLQPGVTLDIEGHGNAIYGNDSQRGLFVYSGTVTIENLGLDNMRAQGGAGAGGWTGGGGGGAGLGGGLFVANDAADGAAPANVTLTNVNFYDDAAAGGAGGLSTGLSSGGGGGGAGLGQPGGFGGAGAGGGTGLDGIPNGIGALGHFGGGGRGGTTGGVGGAGGFGAGGGYGGGGGLGAGGGIFVQQGATLTIAGSTSLQDESGFGSVAGGASIGDGGSGAALGGAIFLQGNQAVWLTPGAGQTTTISQSIADSNSGPGGGGTLVVDGAGTVDLAATNSFMGGILLKQGTLQLTAPGAAGGGTISFAAMADPTLAFNYADAPTNVISGLQAGDFISILDATITGFHYTAATGNLELDFAGKPALNVTLDNNATNLGNLALQGGEITIACFYPGTRIAVPGGEAAVETLETGDLVRTVSGAVRRIRWMGRQPVSTRFGDPLRVLPIRIRAGALGAGLPARDLLLSPAHAVFFEGILIQAGALVNGTSIVREAAVPEVFTYHHIALDSHELLLAEGLAAESFVDNVTPDVFQNAHERDAGAAPVAEMDCPRAQSARQVPKRVRDMLAALAPTAAQARAA